MPAKGPSAVHLVIATWKMSVLISLLWLLDCSQSFTAVHLPAFCFLHKIRHGPFCLMLPDVNFGWLTRVPRMFSEWYTMWPTRRQCAFHSGKDNFTHSCYAQNRYKPWSVHLSVCYGSFALHLCAPPTLVAWIAFSMLDTSFGWVLVNVMLASNALDYSHNNTYFSRVGIFTVNSVNLLTHNVHFHGCVPPLIGLVNNGAVCCKLPAQLTCSSHSSLCLIVCWLMLCLFLNRTLLFTWSF